MIWPEVNVPIIACVHTRGGLLTSAHFSAIFADIGRLVGWRLYKAV